MQISQKNAQSDLQKGKFDPQIGIHGSLIGTLHMLTLLKKNAMKKVYDSRGKVIFQGYIFDCGLVSSRVSLTSWGEGAFLVLVLPPL